MSWAGESKEYKLSLAGEDGEFEQKFGLPREEGPWGSKRND
jgi:hypothetical protein